MMSIVPYHKMERNNLGPLFTSNTCTCMLYNIVNQTTSQSLCSCNTWSFVTYIFPFLNSFANWLHSLECLISSVTMIPVPVGHPRPLHLLLSQALANHTPVYPTTYSMPPGHYSTSQTGQVSSPPFSFSLEIHRLHRQEKRFVMVHQGAMF